MVILFNAQLSTQRCQQLSFFGANMVETTQGWGLVGYVFSEEDLELCHEGFLIQKDSIYSVIDDIKMLLG